MSSTIYNLFVSMMLLSLFSCTKTKTTIVNQSYLSKFNGTHQLSGTITSYDTYELHQADSSIWDDIRTHDHTDSISLRIINDTVISCRYGFIADSVKIKFHSCNDQAGTTTFFSSYFGNHSDNIVYVVLNSKTNTVNYYHKVYLPPHGWPQVYADLHAQ